MCKSKSGSASVRAKSTGLFAYKCSDSRHFAGVYGYQSTKVLIVGGGEIADVFAAFFASWSERNLCHQSIFEKAKLLAEKYPVVTDEFANLAGDARRLISLFARQLLINC